jgi:hypothetical protein
VIVTLSITLLIEGALAFAYARWRKKPAGRLLLAGALGNIITQTLLWGAFLLFPAHYLAMLLTSEAVIWLLEAAVYASFPGLPLTWREAAWLSLGLNLASFGVGWFLPV